MLRLPTFDVVTPTSVEQAVSLLAQPGSRAVAGGTDLLPNLKHRLDQPTKLVSLSGLPQLRFIREDDGVLRLGAGVTLTELSEHEAVRRIAPSLSAAAGAIASPLIRNMGTLGGNVNLDTRCRYVNQTEFWRSAIGGCLKSEGDVCHVVPGGRNCVAAMSSDCVPVLLSLDATIVLSGSTGTRELALVEYFHADGLRHTLRADDELTTELRIRVPVTPRRAIYRKWAVRQSIDFPLVSVALRFDLSSAGLDAVIEGVRVVAGVLGAKPRVVGKLEEVLGCRLDDPRVANIVCEQTFKQCKPLENVPYEADYRRKMLRIQTRRAIAALVGLDSSDKG